MLVASVCISRLQGMSDDLYVPLFMATIMTHVILLLCNVGMSTKIFLITLNATP